MSALETQEGGSHYKDMKIQPVEFVHANGIGFCEATAIKYLCRWRKKGGIEDLRKAIHFIQVLIELETRCHVDTQESPKVNSGPWCSIGCGNLADFYDPRTDAPHTYICSNCACVKSVDTSNLYLLAQVG